MARRAGTEGPEGCTSTGEHPPSPLWTDLDPVVVVVVHELLTLLVGQLTQGHQTLEVRLPGRTRREVQQHRRRFAGRVAEAVDTTGGHVHEVPGRCPDPLLAVEDLHRPGERV